MNKYKRLLASTFLVTAFAFPLKAADDVVINYEALDEISVNYDALDELSPIIDDVKDVCKCSAAKKSVSPKAKVIKKKKNSAVSGKKKQNIKKKPQPVCRNTENIKKTVKTASAPKKPKSIKTETPVKATEKVHTVAEKETKKILTPISDNEVIVNSALEKDKKKLTPTSIKIVREVKVSTADENGNTSIVQDKTEEEIPLKETRGNDGYTVISFETGVTTLNDEDTEKLKLFFSKYNGKSKIKIVSFATGIKGSIESAKRTSLKRALAVRAALIRFGVKSNLIEVRAQGQATDPDKADVVEITVY